MKLNLLMERETAWLCCSWIIARLFSFTSLLPFLFISLVPEPLLLVEQQSSHYALTVLWSQRLESGGGVNVWFWISLHLKGHKRDFCLSWRSFSTQWSIPADCGNSFIFCVAVPFSKQVFSFSFGQIKSC